MTKLMIDKSAVFVSTRANVKIAGAGKTGDFLSLRTAYRVSIASIARCPQQMTTAGFPIHSL